MQRHTISGAVAPSPRKPDLVDDPAHLDSVAAGAVPHVGIGIPRCDDRSLGHHTITSDMNAQADLFGATPPESCVLPSLGSGGTRTRTPNGDVE